uniref:helix-turn-helix domain-containing protein n=1 Tax=Deinococcus sp. TaxID=47478 RepID=UPI0025D73DBB
LSIITPGERNWGALVPELHCIVTGKNRDDLLRLTAESIAFALESTEASTKSGPATITRLDQLDPGVLGALPEHYEVLFLEPAPMNPVSSEIERALAAANISQAELARRIRSSRSAVSRMLSPFYWGHSLEVLRRVAAALGAELSVHLVRKAA